jgi:hypothetical protein
MTRDGVFVNPLTIQSPPAEPISLAERPVFDQERERLLQLLEDGASAPTAQADAGLTGS